MFKTKENLLLAVIACLPYADQMKDLDFTSAAKAISFMWRGTIFNITTDGHISELNGGFSSGGDLSILLTALLKALWVKTLK